MQNLKYIFSLLFAVGLLTMATSCEDFVERYPRASIAEEEVMKDMEGVTATLAGLYHRMSAGTYNHREMNLAGELLSDQMDIAESNAGRMTSHPTTEEGAGFGLWNRLYDDINRTNTIIHRIDDIEDADPVEVERAKGQAHAIRGHLYFDLLRVYARPYLHQEPLVQGEPLGVILKTEPFTGIDERTFQERATIDESYQLVLDDLYQALEYMDDDLSDFPYRFNPVSVKANLARVHLYMGNWQEAADYAQEVIDDAPVSLVDADDRESYLTVFADAPGEESIFELGFAGGDDRPSMNTSVAGMASYEREGSEGYGDVILRRDLVNLLEEYGDWGHPGDEMHYFREKGGQDCWFQDKYSSYRGDAWWDDIKVIRMAEMYLIAAEALYEAGQETQAEEKLMELREHRGMCDVSIQESIDAMDDVDDFIDLVLTERRVELFSEMSHRWFDLRRRGMDITKGVEGDDARGGDPLDFEDYRVVERIPISEVEANENCIQNPGY